jgi:hypothetical protein
VTTPEPLILTDHEGDHLDVRPRISDPERLFVTAESDAEDEAVVVDLDRDQARQLLRWLAAWLGEPEGLALQPDVFHGHTDEGQPWTIANRTLGPCGGCGQPVPAGAFVIQANGHWWHENCTIRSAPEATVTHVEGHPQP